MRGEDYSPKACLHYILDHVPLSAQIKGDMLCAAFNYAEYHNLNILLLHERSTLPLVLKEAQVSRCLLQEAIRIRWPEGFDFLLKHGADPNVLLAEGETLLHILAKGSSRSECYYLERLLKAGADPDARNKNSETP